MSIHHSTLTAIQPPQSGTPDLFTYTDEARAQDSALIRVIRLKSAWRQANERFTVRELQHLQESKVDQAEIDSYAERRAAYQEEVLAHTELNWWLARKGWDLLRVDWRQEPCPTCQRPSRSAERTCAACDYETRALEVA